ncbi:HNH endonuclease signature motif containing protein [Phytoactinopolyspora halotolerans]|uniref:DUF222 domain-containing protein n=1 Tax=Phytoactinopolyspora halotolerans TaxID=1981512 RepID=A0A6L9SCB5_9ACTN|nr:HNH endonuclease signature motif containing protein [Phytoactinopolyspora halotolerans]NEE02198.1 DUF222 domain-containing protein [Phytoactinopolyspora halotolerans]
MFDSSHYSSPDGSGEAAGAGSASRASGSADGFAGTAAETSGQSDRGRGDRGRRGGRGQGDGGDARDEHGADHGGSGQGDHGVAEDADLAGERGGGGGGHLVFDVLDALDAGFAQGREVDAAGLNDDDLAVAIRRVHAVAARQAELFTRLVAESDTRDLGRRMGASSCTAWLREVLNLRPGVAKACVDLGHRLTPPAPVQDWGASVTAVKNARGMPATLAGMVEGAISYEHAVVIAKTMAKIPTDIPADDAARAEDDLAAFAREYDPATLQRLADHLLHVLTSDSLEDRDERAQRKRSLRICDRGDGTVRITGLLGTEAAAIVRSALDPLAAPEPGKDGEKDQRAADQRLADALTELARRALATDTLPTRHGHPTQLLLLANLNTLLDHTTSQNNHGSDGDGSDSAHVDNADADGSGADAHVGSAHSDAGDGRDDGAGGAGGAGVGREGGVFTAGGCTHPDTPPRWLQDTWARRFGVAPAELTHGGPISSESLRRLACDADITTVLVDQHGVPLRVGRTERLVTPGIYTALIARDRGCAFPGCTRPPAWTQAHHIVHWADGGPTDLENLVLVCTHHHRVIHHGGWEVRLGTDGHPEFLPPPWVDPDRTPRRNTRPRHDHQPPPET